MVDGALRPRTCSACNADIPEGSAFCSECGMKVDGGERTTAKRSLLPRAETTTGGQIADPLIGATVADRYVILSLIGRGGMGVVYKVEHAKIGKIMALKLLTGPLARNPETVSRFKREAMMVSKLSHPNTVQVFDYGSAGGLTYLAMEYLSGQDLGELVETNGPQSFATMAKITLAACGALREAHDLGMVHRDIKPENLFLTRTPSGEELVKVLDFGLAKLRESPELGAITTSGNIVGTPYYMAPEQVRGEEVDHRADIYALCSLFYTCITGTYVFDAPTPVGVLTAQLNHDPEPPHMRAPDLGIPPSVSELLLKGLEKRPADRFQSIYEFEEALRAELKGQSSASLQLPHSGYFKRPPEEEAATRDEVEGYERSLRRRGFLARAGLACLIAGATYAGYALFLKSSGPPEFAGHEFEPNHEVKGATKVPFGADVTGRLGQRISPERGDQDNFTVLVPETPGKDRTLTRLSLKALPNMAVCAFVFPEGQERPLHQYCSGEAGRGVSVAQLELLPGSYLLAVQQDRNSYREGPQPFLYENVSDDYVLSLGAAKVDPAFEVEPNEEKQGAEAIDLQKRPSVRGNLGTMRDRDVVCASGAGFGQLIVADAEGGARPRHAALRVTPLGGPLDKIPVRVHGSRPTIEPTERDQPSPWTSPVLDLASGPCLELELVPNPWAPTPHPLTPPASEHEWRVSVVAADAAADESAVPHGTTAPSGAAAPRSPAAPRGASAPNDASAPSDAAPPSDATAPSDAAAPDDPPAPAAP